MQLLDVTFLGDFDGSSYTAGRGGDGSRRVDQNRRRL
ncbi:hypothetical protein JOF29_007244 [Kribbella aluminosa]|uniref:Uncharacterized protein n=1 Tax=Kribbella aluminosa TaxID=416017 RepID=A0ABS4UWW1_9ACTN|nr:hypothetical protein [Kribbella aluminosa]